MKILYDTETQTLKGYNRSDDEPVYGWLDPRYLVLELIEQEKPDHNPATHYLRRTEAIDLDTLQVIRGWELVAHEPLPVIVTMTSLRLALIDAGLYQTITSAINGIEDATEKLKAQTWWSTAQTVRRMHPLVAGIAALAGKTDAQVDAIFAAAQALDNPTP
jgi:hypothetical protein